MWTTSRVSALACWIALAALPRTFAAPAAAAPPAGRAAHLTPLDTAALLLPSALADDRAFLARKAPSVELDASLDLAAGTLVLNHHVLDLTAPPEASAAAVLTAPVCTRVHRVGAYPSRRKGSYARLGMDLTPSCVLAKASAEEGVARVVLTYSATLATIGGLPFDRDAAVTIPLLQLALTYTEANAVPAVIILTRLPNALALPTSRAPSSRSATQTLASWLDWLIVRPLASISAQLSSLALGLSAMGAILWAVFAACEARREGAIRLREVRAEDGDGDGTEVVEEDVWVVAVDKV